ncbi:hypothetical protein Tco_0638792, partial [Tanacetum coccineum]
YPINVSPATCRWRRCQNVAGERVDHCSEDTSSSNEVNTANGVSTASCHNSQGQALISA